MATADLPAEELPYSRLKEEPVKLVERRRKPPMALRPIHSIWRRGIDRIELTRLNLPVRGLTQEHEGIIACQISDFHVDRDEDLGRLEAAVELINRQNPDFIFLTGDYFSGGSTMRRYVGGFSKTLGKLRASKAVLAIPGNHDHWASFDAIEQALRRANIDVLANESRRFEIGGRELVVVGIDDLWSRRSDPARAFKDVAESDPTVVLAHNPDTAMYLKPYHPGVMLSGHTHGGVVRLPLYGTPLKSFLRLGKTFYAGLNLYEDFFIYTNRGLGTFWVRVRINCRPEVSRFRLVPMTASHSHPKRQNGRVKRG